MKKDLKYEEMQNEMVRVSDLIIAEQEELLKRSPDSLNTAEDRKDYMVRSGFIEGYYFHARQLKKYQQNSLVYRVLKFLRLV